mmetsp:Transcript_55249/g.91723  ORF Transcript_55249/g.91723 Transcript_55249/m.91723 type:complete len:245 (-) Transcript_55249:47-781(-)
MRTALRRQLCTVYKRNLSLSSATQRRSRTNTKCKLSYYQSLMYKRYQSNSPRKPNIALQRLIRVGVPVFVIGTGIYTIGKRVIHDNVAPASASEMKDTKYKVRRKHQLEPTEKEPESPALYIRVIEGEVFAEGQDHFSALDAYAMIEYNGKKKKTKAIGSTQHPVWNETVRFKGAKIGQELTLSIWDYDALSSNDFVGIISIPVTDLPTLYNETKHFSVIVKDLDGNDTAKVTIAVEFSGYNGK